jgi:RNA polymerase sigma-70 factor (ECF subfamily)
MYALAAGGAQDRLWDLLLQLLFAVSRPPSASAPPLAAVAGGPSIRALPAPHRRTEAASAPSGLPSGEAPGANREAIDRAIVCDVLSRRPGAVAAAWRHFVPFVQRVLARLAGRDREVDDLTQEVFERFFRRVDQLRSPDAVRPFLYGIALRVVKRDQRYRWLRRHLQVRTDADEIAVGAGDPETREAGRRLLEHIGALKPEQRSLILARYVEEMELQAVAEAHGLSFNTMRRRLERAWALLDRRIANDDLLAQFRRADGQEEGQP